MSAPKTAAPAVCGSNPVLLSKAYFLVVWKWNCVLGTKPSFQGGGVYEELDFPLIKGHSSLKKRPGDKTELRAFVWKSFQTQLPPGVAEYTSLFEL